jgi:hypothetical protein
MPLLNSSIQSIAAKTKDSGTVLFNCAGGSSREVMLNTVAIEVPAKRELMTALRKAFPAGSRVQSLVIQHADGGSFELLDAEVLRCEQYGANGIASPVTRGTPLPGSTRMILVLRARLTRPGG